MCALSSFEVAQTLRPVLHTCLMTLFNKNNFTKYFAFDVINYQSDTEVVIIYDTEVVIIYDTEVVIIYDTEVVIYRGCDNI